MHACQIISIIHLLHVGCTAKAGRFAMKGPIEKEPLSITRLNKTFPSQHKGIPISRSWKIVQKPPKHSTLQVLRSSNVSDIRYERYHDGGSWPDEKLAVQAGLLLPRLLIWYLRSLHNLYRIFIWADNPCGSLVHAYNIFSRNFGHVSATHCRRKMAMKLTIFEYGQLHNLLSPAVDGHSRELEIHKSCLDPNWKSDTNCPSFEDSRSKSLGEDPAYTACFSSWPCSPSQDCVARISS